MLLSDGNVGTGVFGRERRILTSIVGKKYPQPVINYARSLAELLDEPFDKVLESKAVRIYAEKFKY